MSQPDQHTSYVNRRIALYSNNSSLQTSLLAKLIASELGVACNQYSDLSDIPDSTDLLLIDCHSLDISSLRGLAHEINNLPEVTAALLNAEQESEHENLLDWPCVSGLFYADTEQEQLIRGLEQLLDGDFWVPRRLLHHFLDKNRKAPSAIKRPDVKLTKRERQILQLIKDGATNADIAEALSVSEHTVKSHLYNVYKKIGVRNRLEASNWVRDLDDLDNL